MTLERIDANRVRAQEILDLSSREERFRYFRSIDGTNPTIAALVIQTALDEELVPHWLARIFFLQVRWLVNNADPVRTFQCAWVYVSSHDKNQKVRDFFEEQLIQRLNEAGYHAGKLHRGVGDDTPYVLDEGRRIYPSEHSSAPLEPGGYVVYKPADVVRIRRRSTVLFLPCLR